MIRYFHIVGLVSGRGCPLRLKHTLGMNKLKSVVRIRILNYENPILITELTKLEWKERNRKPYPTSYKTTYD